MSKLYTGALALGVLAAILSAFVSIPSAALVLLVLGGVSAIGNGADDNTRLYLITLVLAVGAKALDAVPVAGSDLVTIFSGLGTLAIGGSLVAIVISLSCTLKSGLTK
jgi:hypothetical protein